MENYLYFFLPLYFVIYFSIAFVAKTIIVAKRIGKNPLVLPKDDSAYGLIGLYFKLTLISLFIYVIVFTIFPAFYSYFLPMEFLENNALQYAGISLLIIALILTVIAQSHMKDSWRIGIDTETKTQLIISGLFSISRNPIFLGMMLCLLGLFFATPNALTLIFLILGYVLMQIQIRLEEEFLEKEHGQAYLDYKQKVRRLI